MQEAHENEENTTAGHGPRVARGIQTRSASAAAAAGFLIRTAHGVVNALAPQAGFFCVELFFEATAQ